MRLNKTMKVLAIVLPIFALGACSSSSENNEQSQVDTNESSQTVADAQSDVQITAAQRNEAIEEEKRQELAALRAEHIIYFDYDVSNIASQYSATLDAHAKFLGENSSTTVIIEGHADERGTPEYNIALGERRAKSVVTYLQNMGVAAAQLKVVSYGEEKPMIKDRSESAFTQNRRAVIVY